MIIRELTQKRTSNSKTYLNLDGTHEVHIYPKDIHFEDESGNLHNIDLRFFDEADFDLIEDAISNEKVKDFRKRKDKVKDKKNKNSLNHDLMEFHALKVPFDCVVSRNFKRGYSIGKGADKLHFKPVGASPAKGYPCDDKDNAIEYQDPWNDVDVCLELTDIGIKETLIVKTNLAPPKFTFEVTGNLADDLTSGILKIEPAWLKDAEGTKRDVAQKIRAEDGKTYLELVADMNGLVYPIEIDPTVTLQPDGTAGKDANIYPNAVTSNGGTQTMLALAAGAYETLIQFDLSSIPAGSGVVGSDLYLTGISETDSNNAVFNFYKVTSAWNEMAVTYGTRPTYNVTPVLTVSNGRANALTEYRYNLNTVTQDWLTNGGNNGLYIVSSGATQKNFASSDDTTASRRPKLVIVYTQPPTAPSLTSPNGNETWNAQHTITWNPATDADNQQSELRYQIQLTIDNGGSWSDIVSLTSTGATSYNYDFSLKPESSLCKIRVRAFDGAAYGPWDESDGVFTINHNQAPVMPTNLSPSGDGYDRGQIIRFSWQHNDTNSSDPQSKFDLQWRVVGSNTWNTVTQTTINQYYDMPANTLPDGNIEWQIRTYDQQNLSGPYSPQITFITGDKPASPTITYPTSSAVIPVARPTVTWSSAGQAGFQLQVLDNLNTVVYDSGDLTSTNKAQTIGVDLANNSGYTVKLRIKNSVNVWSDWVSVTITVAYTPPPIPILTITPRNGYLETNINNPTPTGTEPDVVSNDLYRKKVEETTWTRIKSGLIPNETYKDYAVASGVAYDYKLVTYAENGTINESSAYQATLSLKWLWLHDVTDPDGTILHIPCTLEKSQNKEYEATTRRFAGRKGLTVEFGEGENFNFKVKVELIDKWSQLEALADRRATLCARDSRGRKIFGYIPSVPETDKFYGQDVDLEIVALDYSESVDPEEVVLPDGSYFNESTTKVIDGGEF